MPKENLLKKRFKNSTNKKVIVSKEASSQKLGMSLAKKVDKKAKIIKKSKGKITTVKSSPKKKKNISEKIAAPQPEKIQTKTHDINKCRIFYQRRWPQC